MAAKFISASLLAGLAAADTEYRWCMQGNPMYVESTVDCLTEYGSEYTYCMKSVMQEWNHPSDREAVNVKSCATATMCTNPDTAGIYDGDALVDPTSTGIDVNIWCCQSGVDDLQSEPCNGAGALAGTWAAAVLAVGTAVLVL